MEHSIGDFVTHRSSGVCEVTDIASVQGMDPSLLFYYLDPIYGEDKGNVVLVRVSAEGALKKAMGKKEVKELLDNWPKGDDLYILDSKKRKSSYDTALMQGDIKLLTFLVIGAKQRKAREGVLNSMDSMFLSRAEPLVYGQIAHAYGLDYADVYEFIEKHTK
ncbi:MAG: hypothetical protein MJ239_02680 [Bacilli bacterium]|nr:hypothetical protein [Bacilli bacterium]